MKLIALVLIGILIIFAFFYFFQRQLIYFPFPGSVSPEEAGVPEMQVIHLTTQDGLAIQAWYRPPLQSHLPTVLHFHGNAGRISDRAVIVKPFLEENFGVLLLTYRGYSGNPGNPSELGLYRDARAAIEFLKRQENSECIVIYGDSIGAAVAIQMATEYQISALVLQAPFTTLGEIGHYHYPLLPVKWLLKDTFSSIHKAKNIHVPVLIIHGENDDIIPAKFGRKLFDALSEPKQIIIIPNSGHNDLYKPDLIIQYIKGTVHC